MAELTSKPVWQSKTFWFNILTGTLAIVAVVNTDFLTGIGISPESQEVVLKITGLVVAAINIGLRFISTGVVTLKK